MDYSELTSWAVNNLNLIFTEMGSIFAFILAFLKLQEYFGNIKISLHDVVFSADYPSRSTVVGKILENGGVFKWVKMEMEIRNNGRYDNTVKDIILRFDNDPICIHIPYYLEGIGIPEKIERIDIAAHKTISKLLVFDLGAFRDLTPPIKFPLKFTITVRDTTNKKFKKTVTMQTPGSRTFGFWERNDLSW